MQEQQALLHKLQQEYGSTSSPSSTVAVLATGENRKKYAALCSKWIDAEAGIRRIQLDQCILGMSPFLYLAFLNLCPPHSLIPLLLQESSGLSLVSAFR